MLAMKQCSAELITQKTQNIDELVNIKSVKSVRNYFPAKLPLKNEKTEI